MVLWTEPGWIWLLYKGWRGQALTKTITILFYLDSKNPKHFFKIPFSNKIYVWSYKNFLSSQIRKEINRRKMFHCLVSLHFWSLLCHPLPDVEGVKREGRGGEKTPWMQLSCSHFGFQIRATRFSLEGSGIFLGMVQNAASHPARGCDWFVP